MKDIMVTIGIPVYNGSRFIEMAINSVLNQTFQNFELIVTDDGSTDNTYDILKSFKDERIIIIKDGHNKGISYRLNQQVVLARGVFFARMDADDVMFPQRIETQVKEIEKQNVDILYSDAVSINNYNEVIGYKVSKPIKSQKDILAGIVPIHPSVMVKTSVFKHHPYDKAYIQMEDMELWYRLVGKYRFGNLNEPLLFYREDSSPNSKKHKKMIKAKKLFADKYCFSFISKYKIVLASASKALFYLIFEFIKLDRILLARRYRPLEVSEVRKYQDIVNLASKSQ